MCVFHTPFLRHFFHSDLRASFYSKSAYTYVLNFELNYSNHVHFQRNQKKKIKKIHKKDQRSQK